MEIEFCRKNKQRDRKRYTVIEYDENDNICFSEYFYSMTDIALFYGFSHDKIKRIRDGYYKKTKLKIHKNSKKLLKITIINSY
jgi:hypothetical protein